MIHYILFCVNTSESRVSRFDDIEDFHQVSTYLDLPLKQLFRHLMYHVVRYLPIQLTQRVFRRQVKVVVGLQHVPVLGEIILKALDVVGVYLIKFVRQSG